MAEKKTKICDRCGREIQYKVFPVTCVRIVHIVKFGFGDFDYNSSAFDMCRDCTKDFEKFMGGGCADD